jgi:hypothetical protein
MSSSKLSKHLSTIALLFCVVVACRTTQSVREPTVLKSRDGRFELTVPAGWSAAPNLSDKADIQAANKAKEMYVTVLTESKSDFPNTMTLDKFTETTRTGMMSRMNSSESSPSERVTINGSEARLYHLKGTNAGIQAAFLVATVETPEHFHQVVTWTDQSTINENEATLKQVIESFRIVSEKSTGANKSW